MRTLVDSPVWIDYFEGISTRETELLDQWLGRRWILVGDIVFAEVLSVYLHEAERETAEGVLRRFPIVSLGGEGIARKVARNNRVLRSKGVAPLSTVEGFIATYCAESGSALLAHPKAYERFQQHLGLTLA